VASKTIYRMLIELAGHKIDDRWEKGSEPYDVKKWAELDGGNFNGQQIISIENINDQSVPERNESFEVCPNCGFKLGAEDESEESVEPEESIINIDELVESDEFGKSISEKNQELIDAFEKDHDSDDSDKIVCKGVKGDGSPCNFSDNKVRANGFCFMHQDQAPDFKAEAKTNKQNGTKENSEQESKDEPDKTEEGES